MERISTLNNQVTGKAPALSPEMKKEIARSQLQPKKIQILEDQRRLLQECRAKADIDGHHLGQFILGNLYEYRKKVADFVKNDPDFNDYKAWKRDGRDAIRLQVNILLSKLLKEFKFSTKEDFWKQVGVFETMGYGFGAVATKVAVHCFLYAKSILALGTESHIKYAQRAFDMKDFGCFGLTELAHGSNVQGCITTATYDIEQQVFVINTPDFKGQKLWIGNAAHTANMSVVLANLIVKGKDYGIHLFLVPLRDDNHILLPGVSIRDCGDKMGLEGVDNGMMGFRNVKISRESLLNKVTQVAPDGTVTSRFAKKSKRFAVQLAALSDGRVKIGITTLSQGLVTTMIASRFLSVRRQFGAKKYDEQLLLDYPAVQRRLIPLYSSLLISYFSALEVGEMWRQNAKEVLNPKNKMVEEMHAIISIVKPINSWLMMEAARESRALCGGVGFSSYTRIPDIYVENHVNSTWEGDNSVLLQQTGRFILKSFTKMAQGKPVQFQSLDYLTLNDLSEVRCPVQAKEDYLNLDIVEEIMVHIARKTAQDCAIGIQLKMTSSDAYDAWNDSLPFDTENAAKMFGQLYTFRVAKRHILSCPVTSNRNFLSKLLVIHALEIIRRFGQYLLDYVSQEQMEMMEEISLQLFSEVKYNMVASFDYLMMNDTLTQSAIGAEDGNAYDRLISEIFADRRNFGKPSYWRYLWDVRNGQDKVNA